MLWERVRNDRIIGVGRNIVVYDDFKDGLLFIRAGIELSDSHNLDDDLVGWTPSGLAAICVHTGDYSGIGLANKAIENYIKEHSLEPAGVSWEVYGHWNEDPNQQITEVFHLLK